MASIRSRAGSRPVAAPRAAFLLFLVAGTPGCGPSGYLVDRCRDAADVPTLTVGIASLGAAGRAGPLAVGLYGAMDGERWGLRGGECLWRDPVSSFDFSLRESMVCIVWHAEGFVPPSMERLEFWYDDYPDQRYKGFLVKPLFGWMPVSFRNEEDEKKRLAPPYYFTQLEVMAGVFGGIRVGVNPGELLDFLLGTATIDIFDDDLSARAARQTSK